MEIKYQQLNEILNKIDSYQWNDVLFIPQEKLTLESICLVHNSNDLDDEDLDEPKPARDKGLKYGLDITDLNGIKSNLMQQGISNVGNKDFLTAINFYLENDAFILINQLK